MKNKSYNMQTDDVDRLIKQTEQAIINSKKVVFDLIEHNDMLDDDGYPTDACLDVIRLWHWNDAKGWFAFIKSVWYYGDYAWHEKFNEDALCYEYHVSTCGWSGNENIIRAMQNNGMMWHLNWYQSRRGGHYVFELKEFKDDE